MEDTMQGYTHDYTLPQQAEQLLCEAQVKIRYDNWYDARKRIDEARELLQRYLAQDNVVPAEDRADGWVRRSEAQAETDALRKELLHCRQTQKAMNATAMEIVRRSEEVERENTELKAKAEKHKKIDSRYLTQQLGGADPANPLYGKVAVLSGTFEQIGMEREQVADAIQRLGAKLNRSVSRTMQVFVMGNKVGHAKLAEVEGLRREGKEIRIISQLEFKEIVNEYLTDKD